MVVVAIPEEEAEALSEKVKEIKRKKEEPTNPKHDEDEPSGFGPRNRGNDKFKYYSK